MNEFRNPAPTVDILIEVGGQLVWIERKNPPHGWALPGGFIDYGESAEAAARREAREETGLDVELQELLYVYSRPDRDPRQHNLSVVFTATSSDIPVAGDDAKYAKLFDLDAPPSPIVFDHREIFEDYLLFEKTGQRPTPTRYARQHEVSL